MEIYFSTIKRHILLNFEELSQQDVAMFKKHIVHLFDEAIRDSVDAGYDLAEVDSARFAMCALIDEKMMENPSFKNDWQAISLQQTFYGIHNAGSVFYEKLKYEIQQQRSSAWVYWWCLLAGFKGEHCLESYPDRRLRLIREIFKACRSIPTDHTAIFARPPNASERIAS